MAGRDRSPASNLSAVVILAVIAAGMSGCVAMRTVPAARSSTVRLSHTVEPGETVYHIARIYGVSPARLMKVNGLSDPRQLRIGEMLLIPRSAATASLPGGGLWPLRRAERQFAWPVAGGVVSSPFGIRHGVMHEGVDIAAPVGTSVYAADDGVVIFSGRLRGYGNVLIVRHSGGYVTVYAHNERNLVGEGARVVRGQKIADLGTSGRTSGPNLHFEVRYHDQPQNPLAYLPPPASGRAVSFARRGASQ